MLVRLLHVIIVFVAVALPATAELQNVDVGGEIRVRGRWFHNNFNPNHEIRIPAYFLPGRALGPRGTESAYAWSSNTNDRAFVEMDTRLSLRADFTSHVAAVMRLESYDVWGDDFRSDWRTGLDSRAQSDDDVEFLHAYIELSEIHGTPIRLRIGRQDLLFDNGWLISDESNAIRGLSYDGVRATWDTDRWQVDAFWTRIGYGGSTEDDGNVNLAGLHADYRPSDRLSVAGYWYWLRDGQSINDTSFIAPLEWVEDALSVDDYDPTNLHTMGLFARGEAAGFDFALHAAYQFGEADSIGSQFRPFLYGDDKAKFDAWAGDFELGYTFDTAWQPRLYAGGAYFGGEDNRDATLLDRINPFYRPEASLSFVRLFSSESYTDLMDNEKSMSNFWQARVGVQVQPTDTISASLDLAHYEVLDPFDMPVTVGLGGYAVPIAPAFSGWTRRASTDLADALALRIKYHYSEDLVFTFALDYLLPGTALEEIAFVRYNGLENSSGTDRSDAAYIYLLTELKF